MSRRNKGQRAKARRARLAALRAEVVLLLEGQLLPHHLKYNARDTQHLLEDFRLMGGKVPLWASATYVKQSTWMDTPAKDWIYDDQLEANARAYNRAILTGTGIVDLTKGR